MNDEKIKNVLAELKASDVAIDPLGRVILTNSTLMDDLKDSVMQTEKSAGNNYGCCTNGALCKKAALAEVMKTFDGNKV